MTVQKSNLNETPRANRLHIAVFGKRNVGKSSLINALTNQEVSVVSDIPGTTTDPVYRTMEISPLGACVIIDTAGFDDCGDLGQLRIEKSKQILAFADVAIFVVSDYLTVVEKEWIAALKEKNIPIIITVNKSDVLSNTPQLALDISAEYDLQAISISAMQGIGIDRLKDELIRLIPQDFAAGSIVGHLVGEGDTVLLIMPQDIQAPKGRLILPQVQTIRDLLDLRCIVISATLNKMDEALAKLSSPPKLIITDSQVFLSVFQKKPAESRLTSFSVLFARYKGDISAFYQGAAAIDSLKATDCVLIAESCTHAPLGEDIGRVKLPHMLRERVGEALLVEIVSGRDFPTDLSKYALVIHCGACMFNRRFVLSRIEQAQNSRVPITNYGIAIAKLSGILDKIDIL